MSELMEEPGAAEAVPEQEAFAADPEQAAPEEAQQQPEGEEPEAQHQPEAEQPQFDPLEFEAMQDQLAAYRQQQEQVIRALQGQAPQVPQQQAGVNAEDFYDEYGNPNPQALVGAIQQAVAQSVAQSMQPLYQQQMYAAQAQQAAQQQEHYVELVDDMISDNLSRHGDLVADSGQGEMARGLLEARAVQVLGELNQRYGTNPDGSAKPRVLERAIETAADELRGLLNGHGQGALEAERNRLAGLAGAQGEPGAAGAGGVQAPQVRRFGDSIAERYAGGGQAA